MTRWYVDTSAAAKLLVDEAESVALAMTLDTGEAELASGVLLETELRRLAERVPNLTQSAVTQVLAGITIVEMPASLFREAGLLAGASLRSLDALHLAAAIRLGVDAVVTYDIRMADAAHALGFEVLTPGRSDG